MNKDQSESERNTQSDLNDPLLNVDSGNSLTSPKESHLATVKLKRLSKNKSPPEETSASAPPDPAEEELLGQNEEHANPDVEPLCGKQHGKKVSESALLEPTKKHSDTKPLDTELKLNSMRQSGANIHESNAEPEKKYSGMDQNSENLGCFQEQNPLDIIANEQSDIDTTSGKRTPSATALNAHSKVNSESKTHADSKIDSEPASTSSSKKYSDNELHPGSKKPSEAFVSHEIKKLSESETHHIRKKPSQNLAEPNPPEPFEEENKSQKSESGSKIKSNLRLSAYTEGDVINISHDNITKAKAALKTASSLSKNQPATDTMGYMTSTEGVSERVEEEDKTDTEDEMESKSKQKRILLSEEDAECLFGWSLLSPGVMEIKMVPGSDDPNDIIRIRRTPSFQCFLESGDLEKFQHLREQDKKEEFFNENGNLEYTDVLKMTSQIEDDDSALEECVRNPKFEEIKKISKEEAIRSISDQKEEENTENDSKTTTEDIESEPTYSEIQQRASASQQSRKEDEMEISQRPPELEDDHVVMSEGPKQISFEINKDEMFNKYILTSDSTELPNKGKEDGETAMKEPTTSELEAVKNLTKESSLMSLPVKTPEESSKKKKRDSSKPGKSSLKKFSKSKKSQSADEQDPHTSKKEEKKKRSWFRFWF